MGRPCHVSSSFLRRHYALFWLQDFAGWIVYLLGDLRLMLFWCADSFVFVSSFSLFDFVLRLLGG